MRKYISLYGSIRQATDLSITEKCVLHCLIFGTKAKQKVTQREIAYFLGITYRYVKMSVSKLVTEGYAKYVRMGREKRIVVTEKTEYMLEANPRTGGSGLPQGKYSSPSETEFPYEGKPSSPKRGSGVPPKGEAGFPPPNTPYRVKEKNKTERTERPGGLGDRLPSAVGKDGNGNGYGNPRNKCIVQEKDPRGDFGVSAKGQFERLYFAYPNTLKPLTRKGEDECFGRFMDSVHCWKESDRCLRGWRLRDEKATLEEYLGKERWRNV